MANFDTHSHCARCRDKGKGKEPCVSDPQTSNCQICNSLTSDQCQQLATPSYKLKIEKREAKLTDPTPSQDSDQLVDPSSVYWGRRRTGICQISCSRPPHLIKSLRKTITVRKKNLPLQRLLNTVLVLRMNLQNWITNGRSASVVQKL